MGMNEEDLRELWHENVSIVCGSRHILPSDQPTTNALGLRLAWEWARYGLSERERVTLYAAPHPTSHGTRLELARLRHGRDLMYEPYEFHSDIFVTVKEGNVERPLLAAEIEAFPEHAVSYEACSTTRGYWWDLEKLLYLKTPRKLFMARCPTEKLDELQRSIGRKWMEMHEDLKRDECVIVLMPSAATHVDHVRYAILRADEPLFFETLGPWKRE